MDHIIIAETILFYNSPLVVDARDAARRQYVGVAYAVDEVDADASRFTFVQVDRVTMAELERGELDLRTLMSERTAGRVGLGRAYGAPGEQVVIDIVRVAPAESLPEPGMFVPRFALSTAHAA